MTIKNRHPLPLINELFDPWVAPNNYQRSISQLSTTRSAWGRKTYLNMPFTPSMVLWNVWSSISRWLKTVHFRYIHKWSILLTIGIHAIVYLDNIIIHSPTKGQHNKDLQAVFETLRENQLLAKLFNCIFYQRKLPLLVHIVSSEGINPDPKIWKHLPAATPAQ